MAAPPGRFETQHRVVLDDARRMGLAAGSVDLVVTSPPYPMVEMWDASFAAQSEAARDALAAGDGMAAFEAMHAVLDAVWAQCAAALRPGGIACVNVGDATRTIGGGFALFPNAARITSAMARLGLTPLPAIVWRKTTNAPNKFMGSGMLPAGAYVTLEHESILVFRKGGKREFRTEAQRRRRMESAFFWEERNRWFSDLWDLKGERQEVAKGGERRTAAFPLEVPFRLVQMFSVLEDTVLDPFMGTGTTAAAAAASGRSSVGFESDPMFHALATSRLAGVAAESERRAARRLEEHGEFVRRRRAEGGSLAHANVPHGVPVVTRQETGLCLTRVAEVRQAADGTLVTRHEAWPPPPVAAPMPRPASAARPRRSVPAGR